MHTSIYLSTYLLLIELIDHLDKGKMLELKDGIETDQRSIQVRCQTANRVWP